MSQSPQIACQLLKPCYQLKQCDQSAGRQRCFVRDVSHLESVIGVSSVDWFEKLTAEKDGSVPRRESVTESPLPFTSISQLMVTDLKVGTSPDTRTRIPTLTPDVFSPGPIALLEGEESPGSPASFICTPDNYYEAQKPTIGISPVQQREDLDRLLNVPSGVQSLGLNDSCLSWTDSLATPSKHLSLLDESSEDTDKSKDTARVLFSPGKHETTADSVHFLDSTFEEEGNQSIDSQSGSQPTGGMSLPPQNQSGSSKHTIGLNKTGIENWRENFRRRLLEKNDSFQKSPQISSSPKLLNSPFTRKDNDDMPTSPTFSQRARKKSRSTDKASLSILRQREVSSVDQVLSDFFDPPSSAVGKRRPAPTRNKRKSVDLEDEMPSPGACSTPKYDGPRSILSSQKKLRTSSKHVSFADPPSILKNSSSSRKKLLKKRVQFEEIVIKYKTGSEGSNINHTKTELDNVRQKTDLNSSVFEKSKFNPRTEDEKQLEDKNIKKKLLESMTQEITRDIGKDKLESVLNSGEKSTVSQDDEFVGDEFSQVSPSALREMCSAASLPCMANNSVKCEENIPVKEANDGKMNDNKSQVNHVVSPNPNKLTPKRFLYPTRTKITESCPRKVFQYQNQALLGSGKIQLKKGLLSPVILSVGKERQQTSAENKSREEERRIERQQCSNSTDPLKQSTYLSIPKKAPDRMEVEIEEQQSTHASVHVTARGDHYNDNIQGQLETSKVAGGVQTLAAADTGKVSHVPDDGFRSASGKQLTLSQASLSRARELLEKEQSSPNDAMSHSTAPATVSMKDSLDKLPPASQQSLMKQLNCIDLQDIMEGDLDFSEWCEDMEQDPMEELLQDNLDPTIGKHGGSDDRSSEKAAQDEAGLKSKKFMSADMKYKSANDDQKSMACSFGKEQQHVTCKGDNIGNHSSHLGIHEHDSVGFTSASGAKVHLKEASLAQARVLLHGTCEDEMTKDQMEPKPLEHCSLLSGNTLLSVEAETENRKIQTDGVDSIDLNFRLSAAASSCDISLQQDFKTCSTPVGVKENFVGFMTASNKNIDLSHEKLEKAEALLDIDINISTEVLTSVDRENVTKAGDSYIVTSTEHIPNMGGDLQSKSHFGGFMAASKKNIDLSNEKLQKAKTLLDIDEDTSSRDFGSANYKKSLVGNSLIENSKAPTTSDFVPLKSKENVGFMTASDRKIGLSNEKLEKAKAFLEIDLKTSSEYIDSGIGRKPEIAWHRYIEVSKTATTIRNEDVSLKLKDNFAGFVTASNKNICLSNEKLEKACCLLEMDIGTNSTDSNKADDSLVNVKGKSGLRPGALVQGKYLQSATSTSYSDRSDNPSSKFSNTSAYKQGKMSLAEQLQEELNNETCVSGNVVDTELESLRLLKEKQYGNTTGKTESCPNKLSPGSRELTSNKISKASSGREMTGPNVPKGFRPFKAPKITKSIHKYPESKSKDWESVESVSTYTKTAECVEKDTDITIEQNRKTAVHSATEHATLATSLSVNSRNQCDSPWLKDVNMNDCNVSIDGHVHNDGVDRHTDSYMLSDVCVGFSQIFSKENEPDDFMEPVSETTSVLQQSGYTKSPDNVQQEHEIEATNEKGNVNRDLRFQESICNGNASLPSVATRHASGIGFSTASGSVIKLTEKSLSSAQSLFSEDDLQLNTSEGKFDADKGGKLMKYTKYNVQEVEKEIVGNEHSIAKVDEILSLAGLEAEFADDSMDDLHDTEKREESYCASTGEPLVPQNDSLVQYSTCGPTQIGLDVTVSSYAVHNVPAKVSNIILDTLEKKAQQSVSAKDLVEPIVEHMLEMKQCPFGFQAASGSEVIISDKALKEAKKRLEIETTTEGLVEARHASKLKIDKVTETMYEVNKHFQDISKDILTEGANEMCTYQTEDGKNAILSEHSLKLEEQKVDGQTEKHTDYPCMFQTAGGRSVEISELALKHAKQTLEIDEASVEKKQSETALYEQQINVTEQTLEFSKQTDAMNIAEKLASEQINFPCTFQTAGGKNISISEHALQMAKESLDHENVADVGPEKLTSFEAAADKTVTVSEQAVNKAKQNIKLENEIDKNIESKFPCELLAQKGSIKGASNSEKMKMAKESVGWYNKIEPCTSMFQTASSKIVNISDQALIMAKKGLNGDLVSNKEKDITWPSACMFQTASGKNVDVSEHALKMAKQNLNEDDETQKKEFMNSSANMFQTASGKSVSVSEEALIMAKQNLDVDNETERNTELGSNTCLFQTAGGKRVDISEQALKIAKQNLDMDNETGTKSEPIGSNACMFKTAGGKRVSISEQALKIAKQSLDVENQADTKNELKGSNTCMFQTAGGQRVNISEQALKMAKQSLEDDDTLKENAVPCAGLFQTASGISVTISEQALKMAKQNLEIGNGKENTQTFTSKNMFQTAGGRNVGVSEQALKIAKQSLEDDDTLKENAVPCAGLFQTASGISVTISEQALKMAKQNLEIGNGKENTQTFTSKNMFQTAGGRNVGVSEQALKIAKQNFDTDNESPLLQNQETSSTSLFQTARGKNVTVSGQALQMAKQSLEANNTTQDRDNFSSRSLLGKKSDSTIREENKDTCNDDNLEDLIPIKRQKLDWNKEKAVLPSVNESSLRQRRKPLKSAPEGTTTDRRHPGFRPFKPVVCRQLSKPTVDTSQQLQSLLAQKLPVKQKQNPKPSFHTPYKATTATINNQEQKSEAISSTTPVFMTRSKVQPADDHAIDSTAADTVKLTLTSDETVQNVKMVLDDLMVEDMVDKEVKVAEVTAEISSKRNIIDDNAYRKSEQSAKTNRPAEIQVNTVAMETSELDTSSQDEDDMFYCQLVEARQKQEEIIKQRQSKKARPVEGRLLQLKQSMDRLKLTQMIDFRPKAIKSPRVTAETTGDYKFRLADHYGPLTTSVWVGDGALLVPDDAGWVNKEHFYSAFLTLEGVDEKLISREWLFNHYGWIIWKLAAYEVTSSHLAGRCLNPETVMLQLKYRYDREIDKAQRSALKKIFERDDTACKRLVLCVSGIHSQPGVKEGDQSTVFVWLTDGWYRIRAQLDPPLTDMLSAGRIYTGQKLCMAGAELTGGENACSPLEAPESVLLKISCNSCRPAPWDSRLGYQDDPRPLCVPLTGLKGEGGHVGVVDVVLVRKYPILYMEKLAGGGCIFRTSSCEMKVKQEHEARKQSQMEKLYSQMEAAMEKEQKHDVCGGHRKWSVADISALQTGEDVHDAIRSALQPDRVQGCLSDHQMSLYWEYQRKIQEERQFELRSRVQKAWDDQDQGTPERVVTPVLKFRLAGCSTRDMDQSTSSVLTVWRPSPEVSDLQEGKRYKIYSLNASTSRSKYVGHSVQLTATKQTRFRLLGLDENVLDNIYETREALRVGDIRRRQPAYGELDFVGMVINVNLAGSSSSNRGCDTVHLADCQGDILAVRFWGGYKAFGEELFSEGRVLCCSNLMDKNSYRHRQGVPYVDACTEFTHFSNKPQNKAHRTALDKLQSVTKDKKAFRERAALRLQDYSHDPSPIKMVQPTTPTKDQMRFTSISTSSSTSTPTSTSDSASTSTSSTTSTLLTVKTCSTTSDKSSPDSSIQTVRACPTSCVSTPISTPASIQSSSSSRESNKTPPGEAVTPVQELLEELAGTPCSQRLPESQVKGRATQSRMSRLLSYSSPGMLSPLNTPIPRRVNKGFKPPAFTK